MLVNETEFTAAPSVAVRRLRTRRIPIRTSGAGPCARASGSASGAASAAAAANGAISRNTQRQPSTPFTRPPIIRPLTIPTLAVAAISDSARVRSRPGGNRLPISASAAGIAAAEPNPCAIRAATSTPSEGASPAASAAAANRTMPAISIRRRPHRSPRRPAISSVPPKASP